MSGHPWTLGYISSQDSSELSDTHLYFAFQMATSIAIEDVRREVKILRALTGHDNLVKFYDASEDRENVYIVME